MPDNDPILIEIKSAFEKSGTDAAERAQDSLKRKTEDTNKAFTEHERSVLKAHRALGGLTAASHATQGSFGGLSRVLEGFSGRLAELASKATLVVGAFSAGYGIGTAIDKWLGISKAVANAYAPMEKVASIQDRIKAQLGDLNATSLAAVKTQFDSLSETLATTTAQLEKVNATKNALMGAETEAQLAEMEAGMPPGPARDKAILAKRREREQLSIDTRRQQQTEKLKTSQATYDQAEAALMGAQEDFQTATVTERVYARDPRTPLEIKAEKRQRYDAAKLKLNEAQKRFEAIKEQQGQLTDTSRSVFAGLGFEERVSQAKYAGGMAEVTRDEEADAARKQEEAARLAARKQEEAARLATRQQNIREGVSADLSEIATRATRATMEWQQSELKDSEQYLKGEMKGARIQDLRAKAAGTFKAADSAVAAIIVSLEQTAARWKLLEDKLKNLPR